MFGGFEFYLAPMLLASFKFSELSCHVVLKLEGEICVTALVAENPAFGIIQ